MRAANKSKSRIKTRTNAPTAAPETPMPTKTTIMLLRLVRAAQPVSRVELARRLGINRNIVTDTLNPLIARNFIREEPLPISKTLRAQGRPPVGLSFNDAADFFVGVHIGVRGTQVGLTSLGGAILGEEEFSTTNDAAATLEKISQSVTRLRAKVSNRKLKPSA